MDKIGDSSQSIEMDPVSYNFMSKDLEIDPLIEESDDDKDDDFFVPSNVKQMSIRKPEAETPSNLKNFEAELKLQSPIQGKDAPVLDFLHTEIDQVLVQQ